MFPLKQRAHCRRKSSMRPARKSRRKQPYHFLSFRSVHVLIPSFPCDNSGGGVLICKSNQINIKDLQSHIHQPIDPQENNKFGAHAHDPFHVPVRGVIEQDLAVRHQCEGRYSDFTRRLELEPRCNPCPRFEKVRSAWELRSKWRIGSRLRCRKKRLKSFFERYFLLDTRAHFGIQQNTF